ncbi:MAG: hypothetical protein VW124_19800 [Paracoccaceae bacterium]
MRKFIRNFVLGAAAVAATLPFSMNVQAFTLEGKTVTWLVGFAEGGGTDRLTRVLQQKLGEHLPGNPKVIVLNKPGGGSVTASNDFHANAPADGTILMMASTSGMLPALLGAKRAKYNPNEWVAVAGFSRGATMFGISDQLGVKGTDMKADYEALKSANIRFGTETPLSAEMLDFVSIHMLGLKGNYLFGLGSKDAEAALKRGEMNVNTDNTRSYLKDYGKDPKVNPIWAYGYIDSDGNLLRDPGLPNVHTFPEFYKTVTGKAPAGLAYEMQKSLMNAKVMISKTVMLPRGTPDNIRQAYIKALKAVISDPEVAKRINKETGGLPVTYGNQTQKAIAVGTSLDPKVRKWADQFLKENFDLSLD